MNLLFAGTPDFAARHLSALLAGGHRIVAVITRPDKPGKRGKRLVASPVKQLALAHGLPVLQPGRLEAAQLAGFKPDLMVVVAFGQLLRSDVLQTPRNGCINVHASLLPRWRGAAPIQRAILAGDRRTGVCVMQMDAGLDTGPVLCRREVDITGDDTAGTLADKLAAVGCEALVETVDAIAAGRAEPVAQDAEGVTWAEKIGKAEARLDWQRDAIELARQVRAFNPDPGAFAFKDSLRVKVWQARAIDSPASGSPGEIVAATRDGISVACGRGMLLLTRLQLPVGKGTVVTAADLLNSRRADFSPPCYFH